MSLNESIESLRKALHQEIPEEKEIMALYELVKLAHLRVLTATIEKIKFDAKEKIDAAIKKQAKTPENRIDLKEVSTDFSLNIIQNQDNSYKHESTNKSLNNKYAELRVGLNDRMAYVNILFSGSNHDFEMVISSLATMESKEECELFIRDTIRPDYNWEGKEETVDRFLEFIYARFE